MTDLWDGLKNSPLPIVLYGTGNGADKIIRVLEEKGIDFMGVFASDGFAKPSKLFHGFPILTLKDFEKKYGKLNVLMCFGSSRSEVIQNVKSIKEKHNLFAPDVPVYGDILFDGNYYIKTEEQHNNVLRCLADEKSRKTFENIIKYKLSGDVDFLFECEESIDEPYKNILKLSDNEIYLDLGAYRGDTVFEFINHTSAYGKIYALEPDKKTFSKLLESTKHLKNFYPVNALISDRCGTSYLSSKGSRGSSLSRSEKGVKTQSLTVDSLFSDKRVTYIKADVEGAEIPFIKGSENTIKEQKPKMQIACYHRSDDLFEIPQAVLSVRDDYKIYMRHFPSLPAWDTVYFFI